MSKIVWKTNKDKFEAIGYLAKPGVISSIEAAIPEDRLDKFKEEFKDKYTIEYPYIVKAGSKFGFQLRIYLQDTEGCPKFLAKQLDNKYYNRINDTTFIRELVLKYGFKLTHEPQDTTHITQLVYNACKQDKSLKGCKAAFDKGFSVYENFISSLKKNTLKRDIPNPIFSNNDAKAKRAVSRRTKKSITSMEKTAFTEQQLFIMGLIGEEYIFHLLSQKNDNLLRAIGINGEFSIEWFNDGFRNNSDWKDKSVGKGCDIIVTDRKGKLYIEVKSSKRNPAIFAMTSKEMQVMEKKLDKYFVVKVDYLEKLAKGNSPELTIICNPYDKYFKPVKMKSAVFMMGE